MIYLDYAATTPVRREVAEAMLPYFTEECGNPAALHAVRRRAAQARRRARDTVAEVLGVLPAEVYFTSGGTEADNWAVRGIACGAEEAVLVSPIEHAALLEPVSRFRARSIVCRVGEDGIVSPDHVRDLLAKNAAVGLVCVMAVNNETGCVQPVAELAEAAHAGGAYFFSDCVQAASACDLRELARHCDALALSAHKIGGPKGMGALIVRKGVPLAPLIAACAAELPTWRARRDSHRRSCSHRRSGRPSCGIPNRCAPSLNRAFWTPSARKCVQTAPDAFPTSPT